MKRRYRPPADFPPALADESLWPSRADLLRARFEYAREHLPHVDPVELLAEARRARLAELGGARLADLAQL